MTERDHPLEQWADELRGDVVTPLDDAQLRSVASAASAAAGAATAASAAGGAAAASVGAATAGASLVTKIAASVALVVALGTVGAVTGTLPDPIQRWVSDVADDIGIELPRPDDLVDRVSETGVDAPGFDLGDVPEGVDPADVIVPETTRSDTGATSPDPDATLPEVTVPGLDDTVGGTLDETLP